jgi:PKHD-type hydroxylase
MFKHQYWFWESEIKEEFLDKWIEEHFDEDKVQDATINVDSEKQKFDLDESIRKTQVVWVKPGTEIFDTVFQYIQSANKNAGWNFDITGMEDVQLGKYIDGGFYDWHMDTFAPDEGNFQRKLSCVVQLTDPDTYEGGDLVLKTGKNDTDLYTFTRKRGSVIVFPSMVYHKVTPVTRGTRYSAVAWMRGQAFK